MKGYNVTFTRYVGCTHCSNTWHEQTTYDVGPAVKNSAYMNYNACDRCYDPEKQVRREGFEKSNNMYDALFGGISARLK